ncbi:hypothetical protein ACP70R_012569 [Stipagrostis hirtigluma subsp. patula]
MQQPPPASADTNPTASRTTGLAYVEDEAIDFAPEELGPKTQLDEQPFLLPKMVHPPAAAAAALASKVGSPKRRKKESLTSRNAAQRNQDQLESKGGVVDDATLEEEHSVPVAKVVDGVAYDRVDLLASGGALSKKSVKKEARRLEKAARHQQKSKLQQAADQDAKDPFEANYGGVPVREGPRSWKDVGELFVEAAGESVLLRGWLQTIRRGIISIPKEPLRTTTQKVEIQVRKIYCVSLAESNLPFNFEDAARSEEDILRAKKDGEKVVRVNLETRLNDRPLDLRTPTNQAIFKIQSEIDFKFVTFLKERNFVWIHTPKITPGLSEGGAAVFKFDYVNNELASLAQSPQIYKQMAVHGGFKRVFEVGPIFRAEKSNTHRHLCEYIGLHVEMEIKDHYFEEELEMINRQYPFEPLKYLEKTLKLTYDEGITMLKEAGVDIDYTSDLNTEAEKKLGQLVRDKYGTDFFILYQYPLALRPFYTMPSLDNPQYSNSFDVFIRGEEIISGSQRIHNKRLLNDQIKKSGIDERTLKGFVDSFNYGSPPHGGFGAGLERIVMLFCGLPNIRLASLFPRDPHRLVP